MVFRTNVSLAEFSNYKIGGPARYFFDAVNLDELRWVVEEAERKNLSIFILGGGTNLLIGDSGFDGLVIRISLKSLRSEENTIHAEAGVLMENLVAEAARAGLSGLEWAGGLPGTVGGSVRGNACRASAADGYPDHRVCRCARCNAGGA